VKNLANFALFNACWFAAVEGAAQGLVWLGPLAFGAMVLHHLVWLVPAGERRREALYLVGVGLLGASVDTVLHQLDLIVYPTSTAAWPFAVVPPWIVALWVGFATMPRLSLAWLGRRPLAWAVVLGAIGGPLSFWGGTNFGSIAPGGALWTTLAVLGVEYGLLMPLMLAFAPAKRGVSAEPAGGSTRGIRKDSRVSGMPADV